MSENADAGLRELERIIGHTFNDRGLLMTAVTHSSLTDDKENTYERMEFLGDAVVTLVVAQYLYGSEEGYTEGEMTEIKSKVVSRKALMHAGRRLRLDKFLKVDPGLANSSSVAGSLTSDAYESVVGAVFLDSDFDTAKELVLRTLGDELSRAEEEGNIAGFKSILQEKIQTQCKEKPEYRIVQITGPPHDHRFKASVSAGGSVRGEGWGRTKKEAEKNAAKEALDVMFPTGETDNRN